jgi:hypothetical protein
MSASFDLDTETKTDRRSMLKKIGRFAAVSAPAVTLLLAAQTKPAKAVPVSVA